MGIFDRLGLSRSRLDKLEGLLTLGMRSPWAEGSLSAIMWADLIGREAADALPLTREEAMGIPAVAKARNLLVSTIANFPLRALRLDPSTKVDTDVTEAEQPWLYRTNGIVSPHERMAWTVDDLVFHGCSLWVVERGSAGPDENRRAPIVAAERILPQDWTVTEGHILVNEQDVPQDSIILFNPPFEGLLNIANRTLRGARDTEEAWVGRMRNPIPLIELRITDDLEYSQEEVDAYVKAWALARRQENGAVNFTPPGMELVTHGEVKHELFAESRNAIRTDIGSFLNIRAAMLDGTTGIDSLTYTTKDGERNLFYELDLPFWTAPIEATLSQDDIVPRGQRVRFDKYAAYNNPVATGTPVED